MEAIIEIPNGSLIEGELPINKMKLVLAWIEIHREELMANWQLASSGQSIYKIDPLK
jgi:hypothetical protein